MTNSQKKRRTTSLSVQEMNRLAALFHSGRFGVTDLNDKRSKERDVASDEIMRTFVLQYVSRTRPTISQVYRCYQAEIAKLNIERAPSRHLPVLSKYMFRSAIDALDPFSVLAGRHGFDAAVRFLRGSRLLPPLGSSTKAVPQPPLAS